MKKLITSIILGAASVAVFGQNLYLSEIKSERDYVFYNYNDKNLLDSLYSEEPEYSPHYDLYEYNEDGNIIKTIGYDNLSGSDFFCTSYIDYTYNEDGKLATRMNYNSWDKGASFSFGGLLEYKYNEDGKLATVVTSFESWSEPGKYDVFQEDRYFYDELGRLLTIEYYTPDIMSGTNDFVIYNRVQYTYVDETSNIATIRIFQIYEDETEVTKEEYIYSEEGNIVNYTIYKANTGEYTLDSEFKYSYDMNCEISNIVMPSDIESPNYVHQVAKNKITTKEWYGTNFDTDEYGLLGTYQYSYTEKANDAIKDIAIKNAVSVKLSADRNRLFVNNALDLNGKAVTIYDMAGRQMRGVAAVGNNIDISMLRNGVYVLSVDGKSFKFVK